MKKEDVLHIAKLSRLEFDENKIDGFIAHFDNMLENFKALENIDTTGVKPTVHVLEQYNVMRADECGVSMDAEKLLQNAPESEGTAYLVPKVVE